MVATNGNPLDSLPSLLSGNDEPELPWNWRDAGFRDMLAKFGDLTLHVYRVAPRKGRVSAINAGSWTR